MTEKIPIIVGICGPTRCGKGTLSKSLQSRVGVFKIVNCDHFFKVVKPYIEELQMHNWEIPESIGRERDIHHTSESTTLKQMKWVENFGGIIQRINEVVEEFHKNHLPSHKYIIVEGFLLFSFPSIVSLLDKKIFLTISKRTCFTRRMATTPVPPAYFEKILWPSYRENNAHVLAMEDVYILDGEKEKETVLASTLSILEGKPLETREAREIHKRNIENPDQNLEETDPDGYYENTCSVQ